MTYIVIYFLIGLIVLILDQVTKWIIATKLTIGEEISVIGNFFLITSHRNRGAAFGIMQEQRWFFLVITIVVVCAIIWYMRHMRKTGSVALLTGLGMILGGAIGNFWDRALHGEVVDFLLFNFGSYSFPIFNIADSGIVIGVILVLIDSLFLSKDKEKELPVQSEEQQ
ncbi:signal peptidase II [Paenibacillus guangzhouensis]|uniref:signal peptidase II n=1 Tax=Paenibacillus guangzhouensis TaxID=1473112 RepID=UPI002AB2E708|nr:signal peptidase II [Paenibacillus guangzhouensis]